MSFVTVYSKPSCGQCDATYRALTKYGISYRVVDLTENNEALEHVKAMGYQQAPVVVVEGDDEQHWSGFRLDRIRAIAK